MKLFISYCHSDESYINQFRCHIAHLKREGVILEWYDRKIIPGENLSEKIKNNLQTSDIICLFISSKFLASDECDSETKIALELQQKKNIAVIPIILSSCGWKDSSVSHLLVLPRDGKPVNEFAPRDKAWKDVYEGLRKVIENEKKIRSLSVKEHFQNWLQSAELLTQAHFAKDKIRLDDIFTPPQLLKNGENSDDDESINFNELLEDFSLYSPVSIIGEEQSGKTTLCKKIFIELKKRHFIPVYIQDKEGSLAGKIENRIYKTLQEQYDSIGPSDLDKKKIIPIIDDFHLAKNKEKHIADLSDYTHKIIIIDDIFSLNVKDRDLTMDFTFFKITEFSPSLRNELIEKWLSLEENSANRGTNNAYSNIDKMTEWVDTSLGKVISGGIMPSYPFFVLSLIVAYEPSQPLQKEITSQGYCYEALIYFYLMKQKVTEDMDTYINFLTEIAFYFFNENKEELSEDDLFLFIDSVYSKQFNLVIRKEALLKNLHQAAIFSCDNLGNYSFSYKYIYYFFVAKYLVENMKKCEDKIDSILEKLYKNDNAYIAIFISHHSKDSLIIKKLTENADSIFSDNEPASLDKEELEFFDKNIRYIIKAALPNLSSEEARKKNLESQDTIEDNKNDSSYSNEVSERFSNDLRRSIRTLEVMGCIIKNRHGSLERVHLKDIFQKAMDINLRFLKFILYEVKDERCQAMLIHFISRRLERVTGKENLKQEANVIFWNLIFSITHVSLARIVHSLGSDKLMPIVAEVCKERGTPASHIIKQGVLMWYKKRLNIADISQLLDNNTFSDVAKRILKFQVVSHCIMHEVHYKEQQKIERKLGIRRLPQKLHYSKR